MKLLLSLSLLAVLLVGGCTAQDDGSTDTSLSDMYDGGEEVTEEEITDEGDASEEEEPTSVGPTDIPADLIPSR